MDKYCFYVRYEIPEKAGGGDWSDEYKSRIRKFYCILNTCNMIGDGDIGDKFTFNKL